LLEAPIFVIDKRYMQPLVLLPDSSALSSTEAVRETQHRLALSTPKFVRFVIQSDDKVQPPTLAPIVMRRTPDHICIPLTEAGHKRQAPMMQSENVGMRTRQFVKHANAHLQQVQPSLGVAEDIYLPLSLLFN
jgi:hypothetical protein